MYAYDFSGALANPYDGDDSVTGFFVLDQTNGTLVNFSFTTPIFTFDNADSYGSVVTYTPAASPNADFVGLSAGLGDMGIALYFETALSSFDGDTFYTSGITLADGTSTGALLVRFPPASFYLSAFTAGAATPAVPEPPTWLTMILGFAGLAGVGRTAALRARA